MFHNLNWACITDTSPRVYKTSGWRSKLYLGILLYRSKNSKSIPIFTWLHVKRLMRQHVCSLEHSVPFTKLITDMNSIKLEEWNWISLQGLSKGVCSDTSAPTLINLFWWGIGCSVSPSVCMFVHVLYLACDFGMYKIQCLYLVCTSVSSPQLKSRILRKSCWYPHTWNIHSFIESWVAARKMGAKSFFLRFWQWKTPIWRFLGYIFGDASTLLVSSTYR